MFSNTPRSTHSSFSLIHVFVSCRYFPGAVYRPHVDGAWPASGKKDPVLSSNPNNNNNNNNKGGNGNDGGGGGGGAYVYDDGSGQRSKLTMLVYLNEGFEGGGCGVTVNGEW
jgi:hypothetical protein